MISIGDVVRIEYDEATISPGDWGLPPEITCAHLIFAAELVAKGSGGDWFNPPEPNEWEVTLEDIPFAWDDECEEQSFAWEQVDTKGIEECYREQVVYDAEDQT